MRTSRSSFPWRPEGSTAERPSAISLSARLEPLAEDRASSAAALVREATAVLIGWLREGGASSSLRVRLAEGLERFEREQAWRGPVALWLETVRALESIAAREAPGVPLCEVLAEELGLWLQPEEGAWDGRPLSSGIRLPDRRLCAPALVARMARGEAVAVLGWSESVVEVLAVAREQGLAPEVVTSEGGTDLGGRRLARQLVALGVPVRFVHDAALAGALGRVDRLWMGTEAIGARQFLARVGGRALLEEARRLDVRSAVIATSDKLRPGGELVLPRWCETQTFWLWEDAPEGVTVESQAYEAVPHELADAFATEHGLESGTQLSLRALCTGHAPPAATGRSRTRGT